jgi:DNA end-binding protein Ku
MANRAYWKGFLRLSLVSIAVDVYNAVDTKSEISFRQIHKPSGRRINYSKTVEGVGEISNADIVKGYEVDKDQYVTLDPEELQVLKLESSKTIELVKFVDASELDRRYFERPYYLGPGNETSGEGYVVIRDALRKTGKIGLGQMTIGGREWLVAVTPLEDGLAMIMLRYADELKDAAPFFDEVPRAKPDKEMIDLAVELINRKSGKFDPEEFENHYVEALKALVDKKMKGQKIVAPRKEHEPRKVTNLMAALKKSLGDVPEKPKAKTHGAPAARRQVAGRRAGKR